ncbi:MAG: NTP transferase domain-containing protein [Acidimicrobiia bacterium]
MTVAGALLAAGGGTRFSAKDGSHKLLADFRGRPLAEWSIEALLEASFDESIVVIGAVDLDVPAEATVLRNERWSAGLATSLALAIDHARDKGHAALVVGLADQPMVPASAWRAVGAEEAAIAVATYEGVRGNPVRLDSSVWDALPREGDAGARYLMRLRPDLVREVPCEGTAADVDTVEDLTKWS